MDLSRNFTLAELTHSNTAVARGIPNNPGPKEIEALRALVVGVLQPLRDSFGKPIRINSGYRGPALNRAIGGASTSQHQLGEAADIHIPGVPHYDVADRIRDLLPFDQLILEGIVRGDPLRGWVHVSYRVGRLRGQVLTQVRGQSGYQQGLVRL